MYNNCITYFFIWEKVMEELLDTCKEITTSKNLNREILQNTWYKLYLLQNYNISMNMFKGATLRWSSIITYLTHIRAIYKGYKYKDPLSKSLVTFIQGLIDSGTEPYPKVDEKVITIEQLIKSGVLTKREIDYIYEPVGVTEENPDTSSAWTHAFVERESGETHGGSYTDIVDSLPSQVITNPIKSTDLIDSPVAKTLKFGKNKMPKDAIKKIFKLF